MTTFIRTRVKAGDKVIAVNTDDSEILIVGEQYTVEDVEHYADTGADWVLLTELSGCSFLASRFVLAEAADVRRVTVTFTFEVPADTRDDEIAFIVGNAEIQLEDPQGPDGEDAEFSTQHVTSHITINQGESS